MSTDATATAPFYCTRCGFEERFEPTFCTECGLRREGVS